MKKNKGITLIALVITIVILLILAGITIAQLTGNGLFEKAKLAREETLKSQIAEEIQIELMNIISKYTVEGKKLTNVIIQEELENKLEGIEILNDLTGNYKGYKYQIDDNFNVKIIGESTDSIKIKVNKNVGTSYIIINVEANSTNGSIIQYEYIIDGITYQIEQETYIIENLEPESNHTIKVIVIDEKQNKKESREINVKTEPRTYLYKNGDEYISLTGGWKEIHKTDDSTAPVSTSFNMSKLGDNIKITTTGIDKYPYLCGAAIGTTNRIDISNYKYMCAVVTATLGQYSGASICEMTLESDDEYMIYDPNAEICYVDSVNQKTIKWDLSEYNGIYSPAIYIQSEREKTVEANIYEIWLEK